jgi:hypothetical protein
VQSEKNKEKEFDPPAWVGKQQIPQANSGVSVNRDEQAGGVIKRGTHGICLVKTMSATSVRKLVSWLGIVCVCVGGGGGQVL